MSHDYVDHLSWDEANNIAYLALRQNKPGARHATRTLPVRNEAGTAVVAVLDFGEDGELIGIELLDASVQLSTALKAIASESAPNN